MADDVTLLPCPCCGGKAVRVAAPKPNDSKGWVYHALRCENYCLVTTWQCAPEKAAEIWNTRVSDPRIAALEAQLAEARDWSSTLADAADDLRAELREAERELAAIKARRCETCRFRDERGWCEVNARTYPSNGFCSEWEAANADS
jgi:uncharacterized Fe-S radical SAM superfamily protein PflX